MSAAVVIEALGREDLAALVRMAIARGALTGDASEVARARSMVLEGKAAEAKAAWEKADSEHREAMRDAEALEDNQYRREDYVAAAIRAQATEGQLRTAHRIWRRADDRAQQARREVDELYRAKILSQAASSAVRADCADKGNAA